MNKKINLRELKKAKTKLLLLHTTIELAGNDETMELHVEKICERAEVSKVTFFNYFSQKEDLFSYFMAIWGFHRAVEQELKPVIGMAGIRRIFHHAAEDGAKNPGMFLSLIRFLAGAPSTPYVPTITEAEKQVLYPNLALEEVELPHLYQLFQHFLSEAEREGEVRENLTSSELFYVVITIFYGAFLTGHSCGIKDIKAYYDMHLNLLLADS